MNVVWQSFDGRYSDNPRAVYELWKATRPGDLHTWLAHPDHAQYFPPDVVTVPPHGDECIATLEAADLLVANTHTEVDWRKRPDATYLQTWHGTPLKRVHFDVLWAPEGRLDRLTRDVDKWDVLLSPNAASTPRLRRAFGFSGELLESGYPRNDILLAPNRDEVRQRVRAELGLTESTTVVLYAPTWRDDAVFAEGRPEITLALDVDALTTRLGAGYCVLLRVHAAETDRHVLIDGPSIRDVSLHPDVAELYLAADVLVTDYSSVMFDFALTGKPIVYFTYDLARFRDVVRGFYFDLEDEAPGPLANTAPQLVAALLDLPGTQRHYAKEYAAFQARYCNLEDGSATRRVLERLWKN